MRGAIIEKLQDEAKWLNYRPALPHDEVLPLISDLTEPFIEKYLSMDEASMLIYDIGKQNNKLAYINSTYAQDDFDDIRRMIKMAEVTIGPLIKDRWTLVRHIYYRVRDEQILQPQGGPEPLFSSTGGKCSETFCHILPATLALCRHDFKIMADEDSAFAGGMIFEYIGRKTTVSDDERRICGRHDKDQKIPTISEYKVVLKPTVRFVLVVEKMTVTRGIIDCGILENHKDLIGEGVIVSGKGVPDINVRGVLNQVNIRYPGVKICALGDFDPFGIGIVVQTYKQGGASLPSYARKNTVVPSIQFYGLLSGHCESNGFTQRAAQAALLSERDQGRLKALLNDTKVPQECKNELTTMQERGEKVSLDMILQLNTTDLAQWVQNIISTALSSPSNAEPDITPNTRRVPFINTPPREDKEMLCSNLLAEVTRRFDIKFTQLHSDRPKHAHMLQIRHNRLLYFKDPEKKDLLLLRPTHFDISKSEFCKSGPPKEITPEDLPMILSDMGRDVRLLTSIRGLRHLQGIGLGTTIHQIPLPIRMTLDGLDTFLGNYGGFTEIAVFRLLPEDNPDTLTSNYAGDAPGSHTPEDADPTMEQHAYPTTDENVYSTISGEDAYPTTEEEDSLAAAESSKKSAKYWSRRPKNCKRPQFKKGDEDYVEERKKEWQSQRLFLTQIEFAEKIADGAPHRPYRAWRRFLELKSITYTLPSIESPCPFPDPPKPGPDFDYRNRLYMRQSLKCHQDRGQIFQTKNEFCDLLEKQTGITSSWNWNRYMREEGITCTTPIKENTTFDPKIDSGETDEESPSSSEDEDSGFKDKNKVKVIVAKQFFFLEELDYVQESIKFYHSKGYVLSERMFHELLAERPTPSRLKKISSRTHAGWQHFCNQRDIKYNSDSTDTAVKRAVFSPEDSDYVLESIKFYHSKGYVLSERKFYRLLAEGATEGATSPRRVNNWENFCRKRKIKYNSDSTGEIGAVQASDEEVSEEESEQADGRATPEPPSQNSCTRKSMSITLDDMLFAKECREVWERREIVLDQIGFYRRLASTAPHHPARGWKSGCLKYGIIYRHTEQPLSSYEVYRQVYSPPTTGLKRARSPSPNRSESLWPEDNGGLRRSTRLRKTSL
ncbi:hypothetical protein FRC09_004644 [Ceratobasidium sp. 395]|nr:hypothetical protein FRC09_004644 [Ceratobasidium sp. 395]